MDGDVLPGCVAVEVVACVFNSLFLGASGGLAVNRRATPGLLPAWAGACLLASLVSPLARLAQANGDESLAASMQLPSGVFELIAVLVAVLRTGGRWGAPALPAPLAGRAEADRMAPLERAALRAWLVGLVVLGVARAVLAVSPPRTVTRDGPVEIVALLAAAFLDLAVAAHACGAVELVALRRRRAAAAAAARLLEAIGEAGEGEFPAVATCRPRGPLACTRALGAALRTAGSDVCFCVALPTLRLGRARALQLSDLPPADARHLDLGGSAAQISAQFALALEVEATLDAALDADAAGARECGARCSRATAGGWRGRA
jgi:hypothetical protein